MTDDIWKDFGIRITDQRIGMGVGGYDTICVYRIERDEDGGNPQIFVENA